MLFFLQKLSNVVTSTISLFIKEDLFNPVNRNSLIFFQYEFLLYSEKVLVDVLIFIFSAYLLRDLEIVYSLKTTLERIVFTSSGFYFYLVILFINKIFEINKKKWKFL